MKKTLGLVFALVFLIGGAAFAEQVTFDVYPGWNQIAASDVPFNPDPVQLFSGLNIVGNMSRWDAPSQFSTPYDDLDPTGFGNVLLGDGYLLYLDQGGTVSFNGVPDGVPDATGVKTDMWISLPGYQLDGQDKGGWHLIGQPFNHSTPVDKGSGTGDNLFFTDGTTVKTWGDAAAAGWVDGTLSGWDNGSFTITVDGLGDKTEMEANHAYWLYTMKDNLAMIVPAN